MKKLKEKPNDFTIGSGNIFADLGLSNPEERLAKAELARQINNIIKQKKLTQVAAAKLLEIDQPKISALSKGRLSGFSVALPLLSEEEKKRLVDYVLILMTIEEKNKRKKCTPKE